MKKIFQLSFIALPIMLVLDLTWIGIIANNFYRMQLGALYSPHVVVWAVVLFYVIYILGLVYFVIAPAVGSRSCKSAIMRAAFFALIAYGTYDLTNLAITTGWPLLMTFVDMAWGVVCAVVTTTLTYFAATKFFKLG